MVEVPLWPWTKERLVGLALIEKSSDGGAAVTVKLTEVLCVALVAVPVTVRVYVPGAAVPAPTVSVELPPAVTEVGLSVAVAPAGVPLTVRLTVSAEPLVTAVEMVDVPFVPCTRERLAGLALIEKSFVTLPQPGSLKVPIRVLQLNEPSAGMYSLAYQNVHPSVGSILIEL